MARLNREHHRMLGNGYCARPKVMDCQFENICESCTFFQTSIEFRPTLLAQRQDACNKGQVRRAEIYDQLITGLEHHRSLLTTDHPHNADERMFKTTSSGSRSRRKTTASKVGDGLMSLHR